MGDLRTQERRRTLQRRQQRVDIGPPEPGHERRGVLQIRADPHLGHGDQLARELRIVHLAAAEHAGKNVADLLGDSKLALSWPARLLLQPGTISVSKHSTTSPS